MQGMEGAWRVVCRVIWLNEAGSARYAGFSHKKRYKNQKKTKRYHATLHTLHCSIHLNDSEPLLKDS